MAALCCDARVGAARMAPAAWQLRTDPYQEVADCLRDPETFCSGRGVAADKTACDLMQGNSIASDGRAPQRHPLRHGRTAPAGALEEVRPLIEALAETSSSV